MPDRNHYAISALLGGPIGTTRVRVPENLSTEVLAFGGLAA